MNRIARTLSRLKKLSSKALIPYVTPEFPVRGATVPLLRGLAEAGADLLEIGIPFSDPLADGPTIQHSSHVALQNGASVPLIFRAVSEFRMDHDVPVVLMGYINPMLRYGLDRFVREACAAGVDGLIVPDLPPEEAGELLGFCRNRGLSNIFLIAPTTGDERVKMIDNISTDFSYCVSITGVTGERTSLGDNGEFDVFLQRVRKISQKPFVVGFGISRQDHVRHVWQYADGAVVGSALLRSVAGSRTVGDAVNAAVRFLNNLRPES